MKGKTLSDQQRKNDISIDSSIQKQQSSQEDQNIQRESPNERKSKGTFVVFKVKTLKQFKQDISSKQITRSNHRRNTPLYQPQYFVKAVISDYYNTMKPNQIKYYSCTKKGLRNFQTLQNQDVVLILKIPYVFKLFGIFDGHGKYGKAIANVSAEYFKKCIKSCEEQFKRQISDKSIVNIVKNCIKKTNTHLYNYKFDEIQRSGTTALITLISTKTVYTFNIGNSRAVLALQEEQTKKAYDFQITHDHDLDRLDERLRVQKLGSTISPLKDQFGQNYGPDRLWSSGQKAPGTFITRALGLHCGKNAGIIAQPEVSILSYKQKMQFLVMASDGLWAVEQNDQVIDYLSRYAKQNSLGMGVSALLEEAVARWKKKTELMDDISIIVISLTSNE